MFADVRPEEKVAVLRRMQSAGETIAFVGDGVNDAAALAQADLGMAVGAGTDAAIGAADLTLVGGACSSIVSAVELSRTTMSVNPGNLVWACGYNLVAIPGPAAFGYLDPLFAGIAMSASSRIIVGNSLRAAPVRHRPRAQREKRDQRSPAGGPGHGVAAEMMAVAE